MQHRKMTLFNIQSEFIRLGITNLEYWPWYEMMNWFHWST